MNTNNGFVLWARKTLESEIFLHKPDKWFKIFFYLVCRANYEDSETLKRGEMFTSYEAIFIATRAKKNVICKCLRYLEKEDMIISKKTTRGYVRFLPNYAKYQDFQTYGEEQKKNAEKNERRMKEERKQVSIVKANKAKKQIKQKNSYPPTPLRGESETELVIPDLALDLDGHWAPVAASPKKDLTPTQQILEPFYNAFGKDMNYGRNIKAVERLLEKHSVEELVQASQVAMAVQGEQYAPVITDAVSLERNISKLRVFLARKNAPENNPRKIIKF